MPTERPRTPMLAREITAPASLTGPDGRLNPDAIGWARHPLIDTTGIGRSPRRTWGRTKRWEYWGVVTPTHLLALTVSSIDYAAVNEVWMFDRATGRQWHAGATRIPAAGVDLPDRLDSGPAKARAKGLEIDVEPSGDTRPGARARIRLRARIRDASFDITVTRPEGHECLAVVVPFTRMRFQYTVKDVALPATGTVTVDGHTHEVPAGSSWAVLDHGRGRWPYNVRWNWGACSGRSGGRVIGVQVGGQWTDGTDQTENGLVVDGVLHKIHDELTWEFDRDDLLTPWRIHGGGFEASFVPFHDKVSRTNLVVLSSRTDQCFGTWSGSLRTADGERIDFDGIEGWAEDVHNRW